MKVEIIEKNFKPVNLEITFETLKEIHALISLIGYISAEDKSIIVKNKVRSNKTLYTINNLVAEDFISMEKIYNILKDYESNM